MDPDKLEELKEWKASECVLYTRHLLWMAEDTHAEIRAYCHRKITYPFDLQRNAMAFVLLAGAAYNNLLNIVESVNREPKLVRDAWKTQAKREIRVLIDRRDGISHGRLDRWLLKADGGKAETEDVKYPHMPNLTIYLQRDPIYYQWTDKYQGEFPNVLDWQMEVLNEIDHQEHYLVAILDKIRAGEDPNTIPRRSLIVLEWPLKGTWTPEPTE